MIFIDHRVGSRELMRYLPEAQLTHLEFADAAFVGNGPEGTPLHIGIEVKHLEDMLASMVNGRFAGHQLPGLLRDYHVVYLIVEGHYRPHPESGVLQMFRGRERGWADLELSSKRWTARDLNGFLTTIETRYGVKLRRSFDRRETATTILDLHHWWTDKAYEAHRSAQVLDFSGEPLLPISLLRRIAAQLPLIGWKRSGPVAEHFSAETLAEALMHMISADAEEWQQIEGVGKGIAKTVVHELWKERRDANIRPAI